MQLALRAGDILTGACSVQPRFPIALKDLQNGFELPSAGPRRWPGFSLGTPKICFTSVVLQCRYEQISPVHPAARPNTKAPTGLIAKVGTMTQVTLATDVPNSVATACT
jgi:hypothetical protein